MTARQAVMLFSLSRSVCLFWVLLEAARSEQHHWAGLSGLDRCCSSTRRSFFSHGCVPDSFTHPCTYLLKPPLRLFPFLSSCGVTSCSQQAACGLGPGRVGVGGPSPCGFLFSFVPLLR